MSLAFLHRSICAMSYSLLCPVVHPPAWRNEGESHGRCFRLDTSARLIRALQGRRPSKSINDEEGFQNI